MEVAIIHLRTMKTEEEKGSMFTLFGHGVAGPKRKVLFDYSALWVGPQ